MFLSYRYRLLPTKRQHRALEAILESQRELYNAALEERIDAYRKAGISRTYYDQTHALAQWRQSDADGRSISSKAGVRIVEVSPANTTQDCSSCRERVPKDIDVRMHRRPMCGLTIDRDLNAARNVLYRAGVGPGSHNVAEDGMRAGGNLGVSYET